MRTVADADPYGHPTSLHTTVTTDAFGADREHSFISHQRKDTPEELRVLVASSRIFDKPVINLEYGYEGDPRVFSANQAPHLVRRDHYALTLAGGYGCLRKPHAVVFDVSPRRRLRPRGHRHPRSGVPPDPL